jgi:predicted DNA-binding transcriptional regulator AlpA
MSEVENALKQMIREAVHELMPEAAPPREPELITIDAVAEMCGCDKSVIDGLIKDKDRNGFPAIRLGQRTIRIDKQRLYVWLNQGGLNSDGEHHEDRRGEVQGPGLKAVPRAA